jgi:crossover junction endodeoxyribonuclease RuvC
MKILGIDPGSRICGYGVIEIHGNSLELIEYGVVKVNKKNAPLPNRLLEIYNRLTEVIKRTSPDIATFESLFYSKNVQSLVKLSHARAVAVLAAVENDLHISEFTPREIKKSVSGNGNAGKEQVQFMVKTILGIKETPEFYDVTDALAVAICHSIRSDSKTQSVKSWKEFIEQNPDRIVK